MLENAKRLKELTDVLAKSQEILNRGRFYDEPKPEAPSVLTALGDTVDVSGGGVGTFADLLGVMLLPLGLVGVCSMYRMPAVMLLIAGTCHLLRFIHVATNSYRQQRIAEFVGKQSRRKVDIEDLESSIARLVGSVSSLAGGIWLWIG